MNSRPAFPYVSSSEVSSRVIRKAKAHPALSAFWLTAVAITAFHIYAFAKEPSVRVMAAGFISASAFIPAYLWCRRPASYGLPIFPLFAMTFIPKYAFPLAGDDELITIYSDEEGMYAGLTVVFFLLVGTAAWYWIQSHVPLARGSIRAMRDGSGNYLSIAIILGASMYNFGVAGGWFWLEGYMSVIRAVILGLASVGIFVLAYRAGAGQLTIPQRLLFVAALVLQCASHSMSLLLIDCMLLVALAIAAYVIGGGKMLWKTGLALVVLFSVLHQGKDLMRGEYWDGYYRKHIQIYEYPDFLTKWVNYGVEELNSPPHDDQSWTLSERLSLIPLLLKVQAETPDRYPYLSGATYAVIPQLFVPRFFNPNKLSSQEGSNLLSIYYGLQTREATEITTIAWGPLIESYANFGLVGVFGLAIVIAFVDGAVAKAATHVPILSLRMLVAIVFMGLALQVEWTASAYVSALVQSMAIICAGGYFFMPHRPLRPVSALTQGRVRVRSKRPFHF